MGLKLHLGCGKRYIPGFVHIDVERFDHVDYQCSVAELPMIEDGSCCLVYASHVLEYFDSYEADEVLLEWRRVMAPLAILRLSVPDFDQLLEVYRDTGDIQRITGPLFGRIEVGGKGDRRTLYHKTVYNFESLKGQLGRAGFRDCRRYDWRQTIHRDYDDFSQAYYPHLEKDGGLPISLNVECRK